MSHLGVAFMRLISGLPLAWLRAFGALLGGLLYWLAWPRRRVALINLAMCFPEQSLAQRRALARRTFVHFAQAWMDRAWLWHGDPALVRSRLQLRGRIDSLQQNLPTVLFAPHFVGLDAGWTALTLLLPQTFTTIYTPQRDLAIDEWIARGRQRFGRGRLFRREDGVKGIVSALREGQPLYLLPDMNFGPEESIFVPFYGVAAATVPSLSRFARLGRACVVPVLTRMTASGYTVDVLPAWQDFPGQDAVADTARMNLTLQDYIETMPEQYYWVHKRFKTRPDGQPSIY